MSAEDLYRFAIHKFILSGYRYLQQFLCVSLKAARRHTSVIIFKKLFSVILNTSSIGTFSRNVSFPCVNVSSATFPQTTKTTTVDQAIRQSTTTVDQTIVQSTTFPFTSNTEQNPSENDDCLCICADNNINKTDIDIEKRLIELRNNLTIDKTVLTMNRMKRISAYDERTSSKALGAVGIGVICTVVIILFVFDTKTVMDLYIRNKAS
ncbi:hypothetical protein FSP39_010194 [Pinctada imbricata]|uniref:Uncharacterized protein n=1 Tax=Pinctada imbricata TaxID=66713 RepID=A0AA89C8Q3_PINIB|nr:hypothetical protein FSP39_010194 [Pinctada imbricata]